MIYGKKIIIYGVILSLIVMTGLIGIGGCTDEPSRISTLSPALPTSTSNPETTSPVSPENWEPDGVLGENEYLGEMKYGNFEIRWLTDDDTVYFGIRVKTGGWVAVGFNPGDRMKDADMVLGFIIDGLTTVSDQYSTGTFGPHNPDIELGEDTTIQHTGSHRQKLKELLKERQIRGHKDSQAEGHRR